MWIVDTGIYKSGGEFNNVSGRVVYEFPNATDTSADIHPSASTTPYTSAIEDSYNGHGSAVAVIAGGKTWGVARKIKLHAVKVLDDQNHGTMAGLLAGLDYIVGYVIDHPTTRRSVVNMSLTFNASGYTISQDNALYSALSYLIYKNVAVVSAAGNDLVDASSYRPAGLSLYQTSLITVGASQIDYVGNPATSSTDSIAVALATSTDGSNFGSAVDIFAPGKDVDSVRYRKVGSSWTSLQGTYSGTSFATPYVTGTIALYFEAHPTDSVSTMKSALLSNATTGTLNLSAISSLPGGSSTTDRLLFTNGW